MIQCGKLFVIVAPSGAGKTSLVSALVEKLRNCYDFERVITYTTRQPRLQDRQGIDYHFITQQEFVLKVETGFFLEWSSAYGALYGSPVYILDRIKEGRSFFLIVDRTGACALRQLYRPAVLISIRLPIAVLQDRLVGRKTESDEQIELRLKLAMNEIAQEEQEQLCDFMIENDDWQKALEQFEAIILKILNFHEKDV